MAVLQLSIIRAVNIPVGDTKSSDPFIKIYQVFGEKEIKVARTSVIKEQLNPTWNETFTLSGLRGMCFILKLYDQDKVGHDDFLASVKFSASSPLFPLEQEVTLRMKVDSKYKDQYKKSEECRLVVKLSVVEASSGAKQAFINELSSKTVTTGNCIKTPMVSGRRYYSYLYYETEHAFDRLIPFKKPVNKTKDLEKDPVVLQPGYIAPQPPDFKSVPFIEQNCFSFDKDYKPEIECYGGEEKAKGIKFSAWNPLVSPDGCITTGYRFNPLKMLTKVNTIGFGLFLRAPLINWDEFKNIKFVIVDLEEDKKTMKTSKGKSKMELDTEYKTPKPVACIPITPVPNAGGILFLRLKLSDTEMIFETPEPVAPKAPEIPWISRSYGDIMPESVMFLHGPEAINNASRPIKRKFLTYPKMNMDVQEETFILTGTKKITDFMVGLGWDSKTNLDAAIITMEKNGDNIVAGPTCDYLANNLYDGAIVHSGNKMIGSGLGDDETILVNLEKIPTNITHIGVVVCSTKGKDFTDVKNAYTRIAFKDVEIVRANLSKSKKKTAVFTVLFYRSKDDPSQWGLLQVNHFLDADIPPNMAKIITAYVENLRRNGLVP